MARHEEAVRFEGVSKRYRLGLTRRSAPSLVSGWVRGAFTGRPRAAERNEVLWALRDVSFSLRSGDSLALVGPNGAGKTTILKLLANITRPTAGTVCSAGRLSALIELGAGFHPDLTGRDNVFLNGAILGIKRAELQRRFDEIVDFAGLERFMDTPVKRYSSGMIVRLGFAVASCVDPDVLLVDEVLAVGDAAFSQKCLARVHELIRKGTTLVFVSHNLYLVRAACQRALYVCGGRLLCDGDTDGVIQCYEKDLYEERARRFASGQALEDVGGDIVITSVTPSAGVPAAGSLLRTDQPAEFRIAYHASANVGRVQISAFVRRSDGIACCMLRTSRAGADIRIRRGEGVVTLRFERLQLCGGAYFVEAYILDATDSLVLTPGGARSPWFTVAGETLSSSDDSGVFQPMVAWDHLSAVGAEDSTPEHADTAER